LTFDQTQHVGANQEGRSLPKSLTANSESISR